MKSIIENQQNLGFILNSIVDSVISTNMSGIVTGLNRAAEKLLCLDESECVGKRVGEICVVYDQNTLQNSISKWLDVLVTHEKYGFSNGLLLRNGNGEEVSVSESASPLYDENGVIHGLVILLRDVSKEYNERIKRRQIEDQLIKAEKMAAIGTLANGIAHEFNNINAIIKGHVDLLLMGSEVSEDVRKQLTIVQQSVNKGATITSDLMTYSSESKSKLKRIKLSAIVNDTIKILRKDLEEEGIKILINSTNNSEVCLNPDKISQVIFNLVLNASHALIGKDKKVIAIETGEQGGRYFIKVTDNGCGINEEDCQSVFNPFFSTKGEYAKENSPQKQIKGCGLGLAVCHTIVTKHHGGEIELHSEVGKGTEFIVWIPELEFNNLEESEVVDYDFGKGERILILDDEIELRRLIRNVLKDEGYDIFSTDSGNEALLQHQKQPFDVAIIDLKMPQMSGDKFITELNKLPYVPIKIILTGKPKTDLSGLGIFDKMAKPFEFKALAMSIYRGLKLRKEGK